MTDRVYAFERINSKYDELFKEGLRKGDLPMRSTDFGFWGTASVYNLYEFFRKVGLDKYSRFLDLGSGDGRAVLLASLFTEAVGIEGDQELVELSHNVMKELQLQASFLCQDYMEHHLGDYDFLFIYPDKRFTPEFEHKIKSEFSGDLYVYNQIYKPNILDRGKTIWVEQMPITHYKV